MTKLIIQIPCLNEEETLAQTLADLPGAIDGIDVIETLVIDDGSTDDTIKIAEQCGVDYIFQNGTNIGLAQSFQRGLDYALRHGADIIVNTDGDNQYQGADIAKLVLPIINGRADMVVGDRQTQALDHFPPLKRKLQKVGSRAVSRLAGVNIADAVSGFRAFSRKAAMGMIVRSTFSYTTETLIQAGRKRMRIESMPIGTNKVERPSRLFRSIPHFLSRTGRTMLRAYAMYEPLKIFLGLGLILMVIGMAPILRFTVYYIAGDGAGMIQSLIIGGALFIMGGVCVMFALIADLIAFNRLLLEQTLERVRKVEYMLDQQGAVHGKKQFPSGKLRDELGMLTRSIGR